MKVVSGTYGMDTTPENRKTLVSSNNENPASNSMLNGEELDEMGIFKCLESIVTKNSKSQNEITRLRFASAAMTKLITFWKSNSIRFLTVFRVPVDFDTSV